MLSPERIAHVGVGSNLNNPHDQVARALAALDSLPMTEKVAESSLYQTAPIGLVDQPAFINAVACLHTRLEPDALLQALRGIEDAYQRSRSVKNGPRTLDLDLLTYDDRSQSDPKLTLPHPRMHLRAFVLIPLLEISPAAVIPGLGPAINFLPAVQNQGITRLGP